jgi:hypothetical protein
MGTEWTKRLLACGANMRAGAELERHPVRMHIGISPPVDLFKDPGPDCS